MVLGDQSGTILLARGPRQRRIHLGGIFPLTSPRSVTPRHGAYTRPHGPHILPGIRRHRLASRNTGHRIHSWRYGISPCHCSHWSCYWRWHWSCYWRWYWISPWWDEDPMRWHWSCYWGVPVCHLLPPYFTLARLRALPAPRAAFPGLYRFTFL